MAMRKLQKAWRNLRKLFRKKNKSSVGVGTDVSIPEHFQAENVFTFVVANRLTEAVAERDAIRREKDEMAKELEKTRNTLGLAQNEIDILQKELAWFRDLVESTIAIADQDIETLCKPNILLNTDKDCKMDRQIST